MNLFGRTGTLAIRLTATTLVLACVAPASSDPARGDEILTSMVFSGTVDAINPVTGVDQGSVITGLLGQYPSGIAVAPDGSLYVSLESPSGAAVEHFSAAGVLLGSLPLAGSGVTIYSGGGVRVGPDGTVYASDFAAGVTYEFNGATGAYTNAPVYGLNHASGVALDSSGNVYVADYGNQIPASAGATTGGTVVKYNPTTQMVTTVAGAGSGPASPGPNGSPLTSPDGLLVLPNGNVLVSDQAGGASATMEANDILEYNANGSYDKVFAVLPPTPGAPFYSNSPGGMTYTADHTHILVAALGYSEPPGVTGELLEYDLTGNLVATIASGLQGPSDVAYLASAAWNVNSGGNYSGAGNWSSGGLPSGVGLTVTFGAGASTPVNASALTLTVDGSYAAGALTFNSPTTKYTLQSAATGSPSITLANLGAGATVTVAAGTPTPDIRTTLILSDSGGTTFNIAAGSTLLIDSNGGSVTEAAANPGQKLILTGGGTLNVAGTLSYTGGTTIQSGTLELSGPATAFSTAANFTNNSRAPTIGGLFISGVYQLAGVISGTGNVVVDTNSTLTAYQIRQNSLTIGSGANVTLLPSGSGSTTNPTGPNNINFSSSLTSLSIAGTMNAWTGTLDIGNNGLVIAYGSGADPYGTIQNMIESGYDGDHWNGTGITSSLAAAADASHSTPQLNIGLVDFTPGTGNYSNATFIVFEGQTVTTNAILVRLTYMDDLVLAGDMAQSDATSDALLFAANYGTGTTWGVGNLTHSDAPGLQAYASDALMFAANYVTGLPSLDGTTGASAALDSAGGVASVPEPAAIALAALGALALLLKAKSGVTAKKTPRRRP